MELREGAVIADRFRLVRLLGQGGMGEVWAAQHASLDIPCAVKFIHAESAEREDVRARFEREAKAAAQLRSSNVVQILDYGVFENTPYIAMEYLDGEPLNARLKRRGRLDAHETFRIISGVAKALTKAHAAGIVHRDLKPENVFLVPDDEGEIAKVLDFGVAKRTHTLDSNTRTGALLGTPFYMSPEQAQGIKAVDHRADLWSLAVVAFRCLTGELPFKSEALGDLLIKIVTHPLPVPSHVCPGLTETLDGWWARAAQRDPAYRYQTAKELTDALVLALGTSAPSTLGNTPMPGGYPLTSPLPAYGTQNTAGGHSHGGGPALPFGSAAGASYGAQTGQIPHAGYSQQASYGPQPSQFDPATQTTGLPNANAGNIPLGDSGSSASVAGLTAAAAPSKSKRVALVGIAATLVVGGVIGAIVVLRGGRGVATSPTVSPSSGITTSAAVAPTASGEQGDTASELTDGSTSATADTSASSGDSTAGATGATESTTPGVTPPRTGPRSTKPTTSSTATSTTRVITRPPVTAKPASTFDPGF